MLERGQSNFCSMLTQWSCECAIRHWTRECRADTVYTCSHFCEMNTRLQVEHPISEMISGLDLVELQLEIAAGNPLPLTQDQVQRNGHAFEARIYAENTRANFLPDVGLLRHVRLPETSSTVRVDTGFESGDEISVHYDPMIAKLIVHGKDRKDALRMLGKALQEYEVVGPKTNIEFLKSLASHHAFVDGKVETAFIGKFGHELQPPIPAPSAAALANAALYLALRDQQQISAQLTSGSSAWTQLGSFRNTSSQLSSRIFSFGSKQESGNEETDVKASVTLKPHPLLPDTFDLEVISSGGDAGAQTVTFSDVKAQLGEDGTSVITSGLPAEIPSEGDFVPSKSSITTVISRKPTRTEAASSGKSNEKLDLFIEGKQVELEVESPKWLDEVLGKKEAAKGSVICPMPSKVVDIRVKVGQEVEEGDVVIVLEAMKVSDSAYSYLSANDADHLQIISADGTRAKSTQGRKGRESRRQSSRGAGCRRRRARHFRRCRRGCMRVQMTWECEIRDNPAEDHASSFSATSGSRDHICISYLTTPSS